MTDYRDPGPDPAARRIDAGRLWSGGGATAIVAALVAIVGILIARGLAGVAILAPKGEGAWGNASTITYAVLSAAAALVATGLMHLLLISTPRATQFFGWIMVLLTVISMVLPLSLLVRSDARIATALLNLAIGLVITLLVVSVAHSARKVRQRPRTAPIQPQTRRLT